jgi:putative transposase
VTGPKLPMPNDAKSPRRKRLRLPGYDYSTAGGYFVTICAHNHKLVFGSIHDGIVNLNAAGRIIEKHWNELPYHYASVVLDSFVVMPNHVHGVLFLRPPDEMPADGKSGAGHRTARTLGDVIRSFKKFSAREVNKQRGTTGQPLWQRNYYERVIRDQEELRMIRQYIQDNPIRWEFDKENPNRTNQIL